MSRDPTAKHSPFHGMQNSSHTITLVGRRPHRSVARNFPGATRIPRPDFRASPGHSPYSRQRRPLHQSRRVHARHSRATRSRPLEPDEPHHHPYERPHDAFSRRRTHLPAVRQERFRSNQFNFARRPERRADERRRSSRRHDSFQRTLRRNGLEHRRRPFSQRTDRPRNHGRFRSRDRHGRLCFRPASRYARSAAP